MRVITVLVKDATIIINHSSIIKPKYILIPAPAGTNNKPICFIRPFDVASKSLGMVFFIIRPISKIDIPITEPGIGSEKILEIISPNNCRAISIIKPFIKSISIPYLS